MVLRRDSIADLSPRDWDRVWSFASRYTDTTREQLERSIRSKQHLASALAGDELVGMATIDVAAIPFEGATVVRIYTANTLVAESHRGRNLIQRWALAALVRARARYPLAPIFWFFDTFSYRSYLLLSRNFAEYWPRRDVPTPPRVLRLIDAIATPLYGDTWNRERGVVLGHRGKRLKTFVAPIDAATRANPDVRYFEQRNPGHVDGDMLVCMAPLNLANCSRIALRSAARAFRPR